MTYAEKPETYFNDHRPEMMQYVPSAAVRILEIGCGAGAFGAALKERQMCHVTGVESFAAAADSARLALDIVIESTVEAAIPLLQGAESFDCIVANDVLEHLIDPVRVISDLRPTLKEGGVLVASLPNIRYMPVFKDFVLRGQWRYETSGVMDRTHLRFFTQRSLPALFEEGGYRLMEVHGINGLRFPWKFGLLNRLVGRRLEDTRFRQFACVAERT